MKQLSRNFRMSSAMATILMMSATAEAAPGGTAVATTAPAEAKPVLTRAEKQAKQVEVLTKRIASDTTTLAALKLEIETGARLAGVTEGSVIVARVGRADTSKEVTARVVGVKEEESGSLRYKIVYGNGFELDTAVIQSSQIIQVVDESAPATVAEAAAPVAAEAAPVAAPVGYVDPTVQTGVDDYGRPVNGNGVLIAA
jgi:hypothetical protein